MAKLDIVETANVTKNVYLEGREVDILDFGNINKNDLVSRGANIVTTEFIRRSPEEVVLDKYNISVDQYNNICNALQQEIKTILY